MSKKIKKAYSVTWANLPEVEVLIAAETAGNARYLGFLLCRDAYRAARIIEMAVRRAPTYDADVQYARYDGRIFSADGFEQDTVEYFGAPVRLP